MKTTTNRRSQVIKRGGIDPVWADTRPTSVVINDAIPYGRWAMEAYQLRQRGFKSWQSYLKWLQKYSKKRKNS